MVVLCRFHNLKCHLEWLSENGLPSNSGEQGRRKNLGDKAFRYLLAASDRADLDARLKVHADKTVPLMYPGNLALQGKYIEYLLKTRFAGVGHSAYIVGDVKAKQHTQYGLHDHPDASQFNLNVESIIRVLLVDEVDRRAFNGFLSAFEFLCGLSRDGRVMPKDLRRLVRIRKERNARELEPDMSLADKYELMCAYTNLLTEGGVKPTNNPLVRLLYTIHILRPPSLERACCPAARRRYRPPLAAAATGHHTATGNHNQPHLIGPLPPAALEDRTVDLTVHARLHGAAFHHVIWSLFLSQVIYVSHTTAWMRRLTDNEDLLRNAYIHDEVTRAGIEVFAKLVNDPCDFLMSLSLFSPFSLSRSLVSSLSL